MTTLATTEHHRYSLNPLIPGFRTDAGLMWLLDIEKRIEVPLEPASPFDPRSPGGHALATWRTHFGASHVVALLQAGVLIEAEGVDFIDLEARNSRLRGYFQRQTGRDCTTQLADAVVLILGTGGVGSHVAWALSAAEVGTIVVVDFDTVEPSNLNRQLYFGSEVGEHKVTALGRTLNAMSSGSKIVPVHLRVNGVADVERLLRDHRPDFVVRAADSPVEIESWVNQACVAAEVPFTQAGFVGDQGVVGTTYQPGGICSACFVAGGPAERYSGTGVSSSHLSQVVSGLVTSEVFAVLLHGRARLGGQLLVYTDTTGDVRRVEPPLVESCEVCGRHEQAAERRSWPALSLLASLALASVPFVSTYGFWRWWISLIVFAVAQLCFLLASRTPSEAYARSALTAFFTAALTAALVIRFAPAMFGLPLEPWSISEWATASFYAVTMLAVAPFVMTMIMLVLTGVIALPGAFRQNILRNAGPR